jgi:hypothetical protein
MCLSKISKFFYAKDHFKKDVVQQKQFSQNLALLVIKIHLLIQFVDSTWLKCLVMHLCLGIMFPSKKSFHKRFWMIWWKRRFKKICVA